MANSITINSPVDVTAIGFGRDLRSYPRRIEFEGASYDFIDAGLRTVIRSGERIAQVFTMTDGARDYRLRNDGSRWTLLSMSR
ncbi:MAG TPA: hypothetical protein VFZ62_03135 [Candidatus Saccharimonadales bacterium]